MRSAQQRGVRRRDARQRGGAMVIVVAQISVTLFLFVWAGIIIGDWSRQREEQQNQADAVSMVALEIARTQGVDAVCQHPAMQVVMAGNSRAPVTLEDCGSFVEVENPDGTTSLQFVANTDGPLQAGLPGVGTRYLQLDREYAIRTRGTSSVQQAVFDQAEENLPQFVLALDFSGSMLVDFQGQPRYVVLQRVVTDMLNRGYPIDYGLVNYGSDVLNAMPVGAQTADLIAATNNRTPRRGELTNYQAALDRATQLLQATGSERLNILFITDGEPTAGGDPVDAADRARRAGAQIITLNIGGDAGRARLLKDMGGSFDPPEDYANERFYFSAENPAALQAAFDAIVADALCTIGPIDVEIPNGRTAADVVFAVLKTPQGDEVAMTFQPNLISDEVRRTLAYNYDPVGRMVRLTEAACDELLDNGAVVVVRYGGLDLVQ